MTTRAADDFNAIRARMDELRRERGLEQQGETPVPESPERVFGPTRKTIAPPVRKPDPAPAPNPNTSPPDEYDYSWCC